MTRVSWYKKGLVVGIIVLFIGVGVKPVFAGESNTTTLENEDCSDCQESDGYNNLKVNLLFTKIKTINNFVSLISGEDEELISDFSLSDRPLCDFLFSVYSHYQELWWNYAILYQNAEDYISFIYYYILTGVCLLIWIRVMSWYIIIGCEFPFP